MCDVTAAADNLLWKHFCVDAYFSWIPRWFGEYTGDPRAGDPMNDDPIIKCSPDVILCWYREPMKQNESQETRFNDFSALAQEVDKTNPKRLDFMTFRPWLQKPTKPVPGGSI